MPTLLREGTLVDATLIAAPSLPPRTRKNNAIRQCIRPARATQWYFGMKAHLGAARDSKLGHTVVVTAANVVDITKTAELLHGQMARQRGQIQTMAEDAAKETLKASEKAKAAVRAVVAHPFHLLKNLFGHRKVRYRGLAKNGHQRYTLFGLANGMIGARPATA